MQLVTMGCVDLGLPPSEVWKMTYRELAPILRLKRTGEIKLKPMRDAKTEMDDMIANLQAKGVNVG